MQITHTHARAVSDGAAQRQLARTAPTPTAADLPERLRREVLSRLAALQADGLELSLLDLASRAHVPAHQLKRLLGLAGGNASPIEDRAAVRRIRQALDGLELEAPIIAEYLAEDDYTPQQRANIIRLDAVPTGRVRAVIDRELALLRQRYPDVTYNALSQWVGIDERLFMRALGYVPESRTRKNGRVYGGNYAKTIGVERASRILLALDIDLHEVPGL